ncbi:MAG: hypothetical protein O7A08_01795 [SAR324 cluster bacterium]|nr:hypothetical protein [SAR324 cluster bacterium]
MISDQEYNRIREIKRAVESGLLDLPDVDGVSLGFKHVAGKATDDFSICVHVKEKKAKEQCSTGELIPESIQGVATDVVERKDMAGTAPATALAADSKKYRPVVGGCEISTFIDPKAGTRHAGTCGLVVDTQGAGWLVLTNCHVLFSNPKTDGEYFCANECYVGQPLVDHVDPTGKNKAESGNIAMIGKSVLDENIDAGIALTTNGIDATINYIIDIGNIKGSYTITQSDIAGEGYPVKKRGCTTLLTSGFVTHIDFSRNRPDGGPLMKNQLAIGSNGTFADHGDSGSAVVDANNRVVGLLWGIEGWYVASPIAPVLEKLGIDIGTLSLPSQVMRSWCSTTRKAVQETLKSTPAGKNYLQLFLQHYPEFREIAKKDKGYQAIWDKNDGDEIIKALIERVRYPDKPPSAVEVGKSVRARSDVLIKEFAKLCSPELRELMESLDSEVERCYPMSWNQILTHLSSSEQP